MKNKKPNVTKQCIIIHENVKRLNICFWSIIQAQNILSCALNVLKFHSNIIEGF